MRRWLVILKQVQDDESVITACAESSAYSRCFDLARVRWRFTLGQRINMFHATNHVAPCGVLVVEKRRVIKADEELAIGTVGAA